MKHPSRWGSLTWYYGIFLTVVGLYWGWITSGTSVNFWPGSQQIPSGYPFGGDYLFWPAAFVFVTGVVTLVGASIAPRKITYILTDDILRVEKGRIGKRTTEIPRRSISEVEVLPLRLPIIGAVKVRSLLDPEGELVMEKIFRPYKFRDEINRKPV